MVSLKLNPNQELVESQKTKKTSIKEGANVYKVQMPHLYHLAPVCQYEVSDDSRLSEAGEMQATPRGRPASEESKEGRLILAPWLHLREELRKIHRF